MNFFSKLYKTNSLILLEYDNLKDYGTLNKHFFSFLNNMFFYQEMFKLCMCDSHIDSPNNYLIGKRVISPCQWTDKGMETLANNIRMSVIYIAQPYGIDFNFLVKREIYFSEMKGILEFFLIKKKETFSEEKLL